MPRYNDTKLIRRLDWNWPISHHFGNTRLEDVENKLNRVDAVCATNFKTVFAELTELARKIESCKRSQKNQARKHSEEMEILYEDTTRRLNLIRRNNAKRIDAIAARADKHSTEAKRAVTKLVLELRDLFGELEGDSPTIH
jgi:hypothetical protein